MKTSWSPIIIDGFILLVVSTIFVFVLDFCFKSLPSASDTSNPLVSNILQSAVLGSKKTEVAAPVKEIIQKNPSLLNQQDEHGDTPLMRTCYVNFDDYSSTMKMDAIRLPYVAWLIGQEENIVHTLDKDGWNALCWASWSGITQVAGKLIEAGSNVNVADKEGNTPLSIAAMRGNADIVRLLLEQGADKNSIAKNGFRPIDFARQEFERYSASLTSDANNRNRIQRLEDIVRMLSE